MYAAPLSSVSVTGRAFRIDHHYGIQNKCSIRGTCFNTDGTFDDVSAVNDHHAVAVTVRDSNCRTFSITAIMFVSEMHAWLMATKPDVLYSNPPAHVYGKLEGVLAAVEGGRLMLREVSTRGSSFTHVAAMHESITGKITLFVSDAAVSEAFVNIRLDKALFI